MIVFVSLNSCFVEASNPRALDPGCSRGCGAQSLSLWSGTSPEGSGVQEVSSQARGRVSASVHTLCGTTLAPALLKHRPQVPHLQISNPESPGHQPFFVQTVANIAVIVKHHLHWVCAKHWPSFLHLTDETVGWSITGERILPFWNWEVLCAGSNSAPRVSDERL